MSGTLFVICASSGAGKTSLVDYVLDQPEFADRLERVITYTSRLKRNHETAGQDYHFLSEQEFEALIKQGFFLEWSNAYGAYYGTPSSIISLLSQGKSFCVITDIAGALRLKELITKICIIWIAAPSLTILKERLESRGTETESQVKRRLELAYNELEFVQKNNFYCHYLINDEWQKASLKLKNIVENELNKQNFSKSSIFDGQKAKIAI